MIYLLLVASVMVGATLYLLFQAKFQPHLNTILTLSGGFLLAVTLREMLPESYASLGEQAAFWVVVGWLIQIVIEFFSQGFEHGHIRHFTEQKGRIVITALLVHAIFDGIPARSHPHFLYAVLLHKVPISCMLVGLLVRERVSKMQLILSLGLFAAAAPLGAYLDTLSWFVKNQMVILATASGVFLHISATILLESSGKYHQIKWVKAIALLIGLALGLIDL
ncbi:MAG: hypothetical protein V6Z82_02710 [Flavobacteriales bacterium]